MSKILSAAEEWGYITENVARKTKLPRRQYGAERKVLTTVQVRNLVTALNHPARSVTSLLVLTGLRVGELLALRWGSIDLNARLLRVCETVYDGHFDQPKTKRSARTIPIGTETAEIFARIRPRLGLSRILYDGLWGFSAVIVPSLFPTSAYSADEASFRSEANLNALKTSSFGTVVAHEKRLLVRFTIPVETPSARRRF